MSDLTDFIVRRKLELLARRDELQAELAPILAELDEIRRVERATAVAPSPRKPRAAQPGDATIKGLCLRVLASADRPLKAEEIRSRIQVETGQQIDRTSFAPQLSRLVRAEQVARTGMTYEAAGRQSLAIASRGTQTESGGEHGR